MRVRPACAIITRPIVRRSCATPTATVPGVGPPISRADSRNTVPASLCTITLARASTEATYMMVQAHSFQEQRPIVRSMIGFVVIATVLYLFLGPIGILYALGFEVLYLLTYLLTMALAALLDPDVY
jgi:hypothetical protein